MNLKGKLLLVAERLHCQLRTRGLHSDGYACGRHRSEFVVCVSFPTGLVGLVFGPLVATAVRRPVPAKWSITETTTSTSTSTTTTTSTIPSGVANCSGSRLCRLSAVRSFSSTPRILLPGTGRALSTTVGTSVMGAEEDRSNHIARFRHRWDLPGDSYGYG